MYDSEPTGALTVTEFCETYRVGRTFFYEELNAGKLTAIKAGSKTLILKSEAARWAKSLPKLVVFGARFSPTEPVKTGA